MMTTRNEGAHTPEAPLTVEEMEAILDANLDDIPEEEDEDGMTERAILLAIEAAARAVIHHASSDHAEGWERLKLCPYFATLNAVLCEFDQLEAAQAALHNFQKAARQ